jgi:hypothetical protein
MAINPLPEGLPPHHCHWPGCPKDVPPRLWGCYAHWNMLPAKIRGWISATYRPGQEITKNPSAEYMRAAGAARQFARLHPDPTLPPVVQGECVKLKTATLFDNGERFVSSCELRQETRDGKPRSVWWVRLDDGSEWPFDEIIRV